MTEPAGVDPFGVNVGSLTQRARQWIGRRIAGATVSATGVSFQIRATDPERDAARKLFIRLRDRRVFNAFDCCDNCVRNTLASLQEVRKILVESQVEVANFHDGDLFWIADYLRLIIREFLSWEERLRAALGPAQASKEELYIDPVYRAAYIKSLDTVRAHARAALEALADVSQMKLPDGHPLPASIAASVLGLEPGDQ